MPNFTYKATKQDGSTQEGTLEAVDRSTAMSTLVRQGLHPLVVKLGGGTTSKGGRFKFGNRVKTQDMVIFVRQLSTMISAGVPLGRGLTTLSESPSSPYFRGVLRGITKDIENGTELADAFAKYPDVFDDVFVNMVRAGEAGGILDEILKRLALLVEQTASIKKKV